MDAAIEWLNAYGPISWAFAIMFAALTLTLIALGVAHVRYRMILARVSR